jgi:hypothetical protein
LLHLSLTGKDHGTMQIKKLICTFASYIANKRGPWDHENGFAALHLSFMYLKQERTMRP